MQGELCSPYQLLYSCRGLFLCFLSENARVVGWGRLGAGRRGILKKKSWPHNVARVCCQIVDPHRASYGVDNALYAIGQLAQTTMRSELGKISLDKTFEEREALNLNIVKAINEAADAWGLQCMRYEIKDISPPHGIVQASDFPT